MVTDKKQFCDEEIDYKNLDFLRKSILESGRIIPGRLAGLSPSKQRKMAKAIKLARFLALLPYTDKHHKN